jgi:hypothetical protein
MKKLFTFAQQVRLYAALCLGLALAGCGGSGDKPAPSDEQPRMAAAAQAVETGPGNGVIIGSREQQITDLYWWLLGRKPDEVGLLFWTLSPLSIDAIAAGLQRSAELSAQHGWNELGANTRNKIWVDAGSTEAKQDGSERYPFRTLAAAAKSVKSAGTTVYVKPGVYEGGFRTDADGAETAKDGSDGRIYWISTLRWGARIVPSSTGTKDADSSTGWTNTGDYVQIIGFEIDGTKSGVAGFDNWRQGIYTGGGHSTVRENYVHDIGRWFSCSSGAGGAAINLDAYQHGGQVEAIGNWVRDIGQTGPGCNRIQGIYVSSSGSVINNVVYRAGDGAAIHLYHEASNVKVINNTVAAANVGIVVGTGGYRDARVEHKDSLIYNNIVYDNEIGIEEYVAKDGIMGVNYYRNNLVSSNGRDWGPMRNQRGDTLSGDPAFVSYARTRLLPNFHLDAGSDAIGTGTTTLAHDTDFDGRQRDTPNATCVGAYEHAR